ncbi:MAG: glycosyltransferase family 4 protein [Treponema sp.]|nr:glycosyltransferase family 4 protein [Treponema sp.]
MKKIRVGLLVGEFYSNSLPFNNGKGGYGMLARNYITEYIPNDNIEIDTIIGFNKNNKELIHYCDGKKIIYLPKGRRSFIQRFIYKLFKFDVNIYKIVKNYDIFISVEFSQIAFKVLQVLQNIKKSKLILYIQDPRTEEDWKELDTMQKYPQAGYRPNKNYQILLNKLFHQKRLFAISQGNCLIKKAKELYKLPEHLNVDFVPNPIEIPNIPLTELESKQNNIVALGRLDSVKRPWIIGEIAKKLPTYNFYFLGQYHEDDMKKIMEPYTLLNNCHFLGHVEGFEKNRILRDSKILINTSIHEAIPISFLEALAYGLLLVSNRNPDDITSKFGAHIPQINDDGLDSIESFAKEIKFIMENDEYRISIAKKGIDYINGNHSIDNFVQKMRQQIFQTAKA